MICTQRHHAPRSDNSSRLRRRRRSVRRPRQSNVTRSRGSPARLWPSSTVAFVDVEQPDPQFVAAARGQQHRRRRPGPRHVDRGPRDPAPGEVRRRRSRRSVARRDFDARLLGQPAGQRVGFGQRAPRPHAAPDRRARWRAPAARRPGPACSSAGQPGVFEVRHRSASNCSGTRRCPSWRRRTAVRCRRPAGAVLRRRRLRCRYRRPRPKVPSSQPHSARDDAAQYLVGAAAQREHRLVQPCGGQQGGHLGVLGDWSSRSAITPTDSCSKRVPRSLTSAA